MRASFGGTTGDLGSFFASLFSQQESQAKADAKQAEYDAKQAAADKKAQQSANDQDALNQWQNGVSSDEEWLAYIANRVNTETDPTEHEKWVKYQREYTQQISDNQAEYKYKTGQMSIAQYIAYEKGVLTGLDKNSQAYRDRALMTSQLLDTQAQNDLNANVQRISDGIKAGKSTYKDLLKAYQDGLKTTTNAELKTQIQGKIADVQAQITADEAQGALDKIDYQFKSNHISGKAAGAALRAVAEKYFKGDEHKFYSVLDSALTYEKYPSLYKDGLKVKAASGGGGGRSSGGGGGGTSKKAAAAAVKAAVQLDRAYVNRGKDITQQYIETQGKGPIVDPLTGKPIPVGPDGMIPLATIHQVQLQTIAHLDHLTSVYNAQKEPKQATQAQKDKTYFIAGGQGTPGAVQLINSIKPAEQVQSVIQSMGRALDAASRSNDPSEMLTVAAHYGEVLSAYRNRLATTANGQPEPLASSVDKRILDELDATVTVLQQASIPGADTAGLLDYIKKTTGTYVPDRVISAVAKSLSDRANVINDIGTGKQTFVLAADGIDLVPNVSRFTPQLDPVTGKPTASVGYSSEPDLSAIPGISPKDLADIKLVPAFFDMNGKPYPAQVVTYSYQSPDYKTWTATKAVTIDGVKLAAGQAVPPDLLDKIIGAQTALSHATDRTAEDVALAVQKSQVAYLVGSGAVGQTPVDMGWRIAFVGGYSDGQGQVAPQVWYGDPHLGLWSQSADWVQTVARNPDGTVSVDANGVPQSVTYKPNASSGMVRFPYSGVNPSAMQQIANATPVNGEQVVDELGNLRPGTADDYAKAYYDADLEDMRRARAAGMSLQLGGQPDAQWYDSTVQNTKVDRAKSDALQAFRVATAKTQAPSFADGEQIATGLADFAARLGVTTGTSRQKTPDLSAVPNRSAGATTHPLPPITSPINTFNPVIAPKAPELNADGMPQVVGPTLKPPTITAPRVAPPVAPKVTAPPPANLGAGALAQPAPRKGVQATATVDLSKPQPKPKPKPISRSGPQQPT